MDNNSEDRPIKGADSRLTVDEDEIDLRRLWDILLGNRWTIIAVTLAVFAVGLAYAFLAEPVYQSDALIQVERKNSGLSDLEGLSPLLSEPPPADTEIQIIKSRNIIGRTVDQLDLTVHAAPIYFPVIGKRLAGAPAEGGVAQPWFGLRSYAWGGERIVVKQLAVSPDLVGVPLLLIAGTEGRYELLGPDGAVRLRGEVGAPASAGGIDIFLSELQARPGTQFEVSRRDRLAVIAGVQSALQISEQGKGTGILRATLRTADPARARRILQTIAEVYVRQNIERRSAQAEESLKFLQGQLPKLRGELSAAEQELNDFRQENRALDLTVETEKLLEQFVQLESKISEAQIRRAEMAERFTPRHPQMQALERQLAELREQRAALEQRVAGLPDTQQALLRLQREVKVKTELYTALLNRAQELQVVKAGTVGNVRIVDEAIRPRRPVEPNRPMIASVSGFLGLFLAVGMVFARNALRGRIRGPDELEGRLGLPTYAVIPHSRAEHKGRRRAERHHSVYPVLALQHPTDMAVEGIRSFRTALHFGLMNSERKVIVITGASPHVGKSFLSVNTAVVAAEAGMRVLLIDADLRRGRLHEYQSEHRSPGLSEVLSGQAKVAQALRHLHENVDLLTTGALPPNPSELLMAARFERLVDEAAKNYDLVVMDVPPVLAVTDAAIVARHAGAVFLVVRAEQNTLDEVDTAIKRLAQNGSRVAGILFNDLGAGEGRGRYSSYYYYHYDYKQAKGTQSEQRAKAG